LFWWSIPTPAQRNINRRPRDTTRINQ
jgi:hypothetical protein